MSFFHGALGLGEFPSAPIVAYLARSLSGLYVLHGGFLWMAARDVQKHAPIITYVAVSGIAFSIMVTIVSVAAGFPWWWTVCEGPMLTVLSVVILFLQSRIR
jgi:hypothetical protein